MLHTANNCVDKVVVDERGVQVPNVTSFDDVTNEVEMVIQNGKLGVVENGNIKKVKFILEGAKLVPRDKARRG